MPEAEQYQWRLDVIMNAYGVRVDTGLIEGALYINDVSTQELTDEAVSITGLANPNSGAQLVPWLNERCGKAQFTDIQKATVAEALENREVYPEGVQRMLEIRQQLGKTSIKKYVAMDTAKGEGNRVRGLTQYYGANRTGRWAGRLVQMPEPSEKLYQNLGLCQGAGKTERLCRAAAPVWKCPGYPFTADPDGVHPIGRT